MNIKEQKLTRVFTDNDLLELYKSINHLSFLYKGRIYGDMQQKTSKTISFLTTLVRDRPFIFAFWLCNHKACNYFAREMYAMLFFTNPQQANLKSFQSTYFFAITIISICGVKYNSRFSFAIITLVFNAEKLGIFVFCNFDKEHLNNWGKKQINCGEIKTMYNAKEKETKPQSKWLRKPKQVEGELEDNAYKERLNIYCLVAESIDAHSEQMLKLLIEFKKEQGHCVITANHPNWRLISWTKWLRQAKQKELLLWKKVAKLTTLGFIWCEEENLYQQNIIKLRQFIAIHGHGYVPANYREDPAFGFWAKNTRRNELLGRLSAVRNAELDLLGFVWNEGLTEINNENSINSNLFVGELL